MSIRRIMLMITILAVLLSVKLLIAKPNVELSVKPKENKIDDGIVEGSLIEVAILQVEEWIKSMKYFPGSLEIEVSKLLVGHEIWIYFSTAKMRSEGFKSKIEISPYDLPTHIVLFAQLPKIDVPEKKFLVIKLKLYWHGSLIDEWYYEVLVYDSSYAKTKEVIEMNNVLLILTVILAVIALVLAVITLFSERRKRKSPPYIPGGGL